MHIKRYFYIGGLKVCILNKNPGHIKVEGSDTFFDLTNLIKIIEINRYVRYFVLFIKPINISALRFFFSLWFKSFYEYVLSIIISSTSSWKYVLV